MTGLPPLRLKSAWTVLAAASVLIACVEAASAQPEPSRTVPQADSAEQARAAYRRAIAAFRQRDTLAARRELARAADWWPTQQFYLQASAQLAAASRDTVDAARWLDRLARMGIGTAPDADTVFRRLVGTAIFDSAAARLARATAPVPRSRVRLTVPDTMFHAEGVAFDAVKGRWFVGSVRQRRIVAVERDGAVHDFVSPAADGIAGVFGLAVDGPRRRLWAATTALPRMEGFAPQDSGRVGIYGYNLDTGRLERHAWMPRDSSTAHTFGDVVVAPNGDVYVSDSQAPWIHVLRLGSDSLVRFLTHPLFRSLQGMAITPDGSTMFAADYSHGLVRIDLPARTVTALPPPNGVTLLGLDGLYLHRGTLIAVQNGVTPPRLVRICLDPTLTAVRALEVLDRNPTLVDEPTLGAIAGDSAFYVATSEWEKFDDAGNRVAGARLRPATVVALALDSSAACRR